MFPTTDNPAGRLLSILQEAARFEPHHSVAHVWGTLFGINRDDKPSLYLALGHLNLLADEIVFRIKQIEELNHQLYLRDMGSIKSVISPNSLGDPWAQYLSPLKLGALTSLEFCSNELSKRHTEENISKEEIDKLKIRVSQLFQEVTKSDLDPELKSVLYELITSIQMALDYYRIKGADGIKKAVVYSAGLLALHKSRYNDKKDSATIKSVFEFFKNLVDLVKTAYKLKELTGDAKELLRLM